VSGWVVFGVVVLGAVAIIVAQYFGWIDLSNKNRSGGSGGIAGIGDEVFHPTRHETQAEFDRQTILPAPAPLAGDGDKGIYRGRVEIDLNDKPR